MNFGSARILVIVALVVAGVAILTDGFGHGVATVGASGGTLTSPTASSSSHPTNSPTPTQVALPSPQAPKDVTIAVFNGTSSLGLAAQGQAVLTAVGYVAGQDPQNSPVQGGAAKTIIYFRGGPDAAQNKADAKLIADTYFNGAKVALLGNDFQTAIAGPVTVTIVLGQDYADAHHA